MCKAPGHRTFLIHSPLSINMRISLERMPLKGRKLPGALVVVLLVLALLGLGIQWTLSPRFAAAGCDQARVTIYVGREVAEVENLLVKNEGGRALALEKYATGSSGRVEKLGGVIYLSAGGAGTFSFATGGSVAEVTLTDRECRQASDLWVFK